MSIKKYIPTLFTVAAAGGVVATAITAIKRTPKAIDILESMQVAKDADLTTWEKIRYAAPVYLPTILVGGATIGLIFSANAAHRKIEAALIASCMALEEAFEAKRENVRTFTTAKYEAPKDKMIFVEDFLTVPFLKTADEVMEAEEKLNELFHEKGFATLADFYELLGVDELADPITKEFGWSIFMGDDQGYVDIVFNHETFTDETCGKDGDSEYTLISYEHEPVINYMYPLWGE